MLDLVFPVACAVCGVLGASPCADCFAALRRPPPLPAPLGVDRLVALLAYEGTGRELVARLKYRNARATVPWLASDLAGLVNPLPIDLVTWVPTTGRRRRRRGFDQAQLLAEALAGEIGHPCVRLLRRGSGPPQTGRPLAERQRRPDLRARRRIDGAHVLVVDDVCTTGTTLTAAAHALRSAGAATVSAAVAARTLRHGDSRTTTQGGNRADRSNQQMMGNDRPEATTPMQELRQRLSEDVIDDLLAVPRVRPDVVARARALLHTTRWCRAEEIASELVDCYVGQRVP